MKTSEGTFAGKPMLYIHEDNAEEGAKAVIQFGIKKAEAILESIEEIKAFVEKNKK